MKTTLKNKDIRILFWGTSEFAIPALQALLKAGYELVGVVTTPDRPRGRNQALTPPPVKVCANDHSLLVYQPETLKPTGYLLELPDADLFIVASYGKIIPKRVLELPKLGALNIHPSLLPRWRGPSPIQYTILFGDAETGVTIIKMDELMDHGPIIGVAGHNLQGERVTYPELHRELSEKGAGLLVEILPSWVSGAIAPIEQDESKVTFSKILTKEDGRIDWKKPARDIEREIRAFTPWPGSWTIAALGDRQSRIRIDKARSNSSSIPEKAPGTIVEAEDRTLMVQCGNGFLEIVSLTVEGESPRKASEFLKGHAGIIGSVLR